MNGKLAALISRSTKLTEDWMDTNPKQKVSSVGSLKTAGPLASKQDDNDTSSVSRYALILRRKEGGW